jgi:type I restriction enzyme S subunit
MKDGRIEADSNFTISDEKKKELSSYLLKIHDIVFGRRGDIGRCALVTQKENGFLCGTGSLFVRFTININPLYSLKILSSSSVKQYLLENARGATMLNLNSSVIEGISIPLPPLSLQQEFAAKVEAIEAMKAKVRQSLKEVETLFNERMDYYFN